jgi:hypothetical protein
MKRIILLTFILKTSLAIAQTIPYEKLDSISSEISKLQLKANDLTYKDAKGNEYEISFSDKNFEVLFHNQLAYKSVYKKWDGKEILALTENIDLSKVTAITKHTSFTDVILVKLYFPTGYLKTQLFENGTLTNTITEEYLEFFTTNKSRDLLGEGLLDLVVLFKITKGLTTAEKIEEENEYYKSHSEEEFLDKYPLSLKAKQSKLIIKEKEEKIKKGEEYFMKYVGCEFYEIGIPIENAKIKFPQFFSKYWVDKYNGENGYDSRYMSKKKEITVFLYGKSGRLVGYDRKTLYGNVQSFIDDFTEKFKFSPTQRKFYQFLDYTWEKNGKNLTIRYDTKTTEIELRQFDSQNDNRWGDNPQDNAINPLKSENSNSKNNAINLLKSVNTSSVNNTKTNTTTPITETSTLDEKEAYEKAKIDFKAGTISKEAYKAAMNKYGTYVFEENKRLIKAYKNKEITYAEYIAAFRKLTKK